MKFVEIILEIIGLLFILRIFDKLFIRNKYFDNSIVVKKLDEKSEEYKSFKSIMMYKKDEDASDITCIYSLTNPIKLINIYDGKKLVKSYDNLTKGDPLFVLADYKEIPNTKIEIINYRFDKTTIYFDNNGSIFTDIRIYKRNIISIILDFIYN